MRYAARVITGQGRGRRIGFPTLNLAIPELFPFTHGIYAGFVWIDGRRYSAAFHFGPIPTFGEATPSLEAHLIDAAIEHVPAEIEFEFVQFIREIKNFSSAAELAAHIARDVEDVRHALRKTAMDEISR